jgi:photosystem II protein
MAAALAQKSFAGPSVARKAVRVQRRQAVVLASGGGKTDLKKVGVNSVEDEVVKNNLLGVSRYMNKKDWVDSSGRKGKGKGVYAFQDKYGANVDAYQPIYTPDDWAASGTEYKLGTKGLIAWAGLVVVLLGVGANLIYSTSQLGQ